MLKRTLAVILLLLHSAVSIGADPAPSLRKLDELMHKSGLWNQVASLASDMKGGFEQGASTGKAPGGAKLTQEQIERVKAAMDRGFSADALRPRIRSSLARNLSTADLDAALTWLQTDVGRMFTRVEEADSAQGSTARRAEAQRLFSILASQRVARLERLASAMGSGDRTATMVTNMMLTSAQAFALAMPNADPGAVGDLKRKLEADRPAMVKRAFERAVISYGYVYRSASDAELDRYIEFAESPSGMRYNDAMAVALTEALVAGAGEMTRHITRAAEMGRKAS